MKPKRMISRQKPINQERAFALWKSQIERILGELEEALHSPLPESETVYEEIEPDHPDYDKSAYEVIWNVHPLHFVFDKEKQRFVKKT